MPSPSRAYGVVAIGSGIGALVIGRLGVALGHWYVRGHMPDAELEGIIPPLVGSAAGAWLGAVLGGWYALWQCQRGAIRETLVGLGLLVPLVLIAWIMGLTRLPAFNANYPWLIWFGAVGCISLAAMLARWLALRKR